MNNLCIITLFKTNKICVSTLSQTKIRLQRYYFFLIYANFSARNLSKLHKIVKNTFSKLHKIGISQVLNCTKSKTLQFFLSSECIILQLLIY